MTCDDRHPKFSLTFNVRVAEPQVRQLHELPNIGRNGSWGAAGRQDKAGSCRRENAKSSKKQLNIADHPPGHVMTVTPILVPPSIFVELRYKPLSFTSFPISGGMIPGKQWGGKASEAGSCQRQKSESSKKQLISPDHAPGHVIIALETYSRKMAESYLTGW